MKPNWLSREVAAKGPHLILCLSPKELAAACADVGAPAQEWPDSNARTITIDRAEHEPVCIVALTVGMDDNTGIQIASILIHEAVHVWQEHIRHIGEDEPSSEMEAYGIQNISYTLMEEFSRRVCTNKSNG